MSVSKFIKTATYCLEDNKVCINYFHVVGDTVSTEIMFRRYLEVPEIPDLSVDGMTQLYLLNEYYQYFFNLFTEVPSKVPWLKEPNTPVEDLIKLSMEAATQVVVRGKVFS